jgi:hypothetical protein
LGEDHRPAGQAALTRFVDDAAVPIDNSPTERESQNVAKLRLNMLFAGSTEGARRACVLLGSDDHAGRELLRLDFEDQCCLVRARLRRTEPAVQRQLGLRR